MTHADSFPPRRGRAARLALALALLPGAHGAIAAAEPQAAARAVPALEAETARPPRGFFRAYLEARDVEPSFQTAKAERDVIEVSASQSRAAYLPQLNYTRSRSEIETHERTTLQVVQPILAADRLATMREGKYRDALGDHTFRQREQELALRVFRNVAEIIRHRESLDANQAKVRALTQQLASAKRMFELGEGTITDLRDTEVRLGQARADGLTAQGRLRAALRLFEVTCGRAVQADEFRLAGDARELPLKPDELPAFAAPAGGNAQVAIAQQNYELARLATLKARASSLPVVSGSFVQTEINGRKTEYTGVTLSMPLQPASIFTVRTAKAGEYRAQETVREAESRMRVDLERYAALLEAAVVEVRYRRDNIAAAELNVRANEKSFAGGVRSQTDVLNAIQLRFQASEEFVASSLALAENYLNLLITADVPPADAMQLVNRLLL